VISKFFTKE